MWSTYKFSHLYSSIHILVLLIVAYCIKNIWNFPWWNFQIFFYFPIHLNRQKFYCVLTSTFFQTEDSHQMVCSPDPNITDEDNGVRVVGDRECSSRSSTGGVETPETSARLSTGGGEAGGVGGAPSNSSSPAHSPAASAASSDQTTSRTSVPLQPPPFSHMFPFGDR